MSDENLIKIISNFLKPNLAQPDGSVYSEECLKDMVRQIQEKIDKYGCVPGTFQNWCYQPISVKDITHLIKEVSYDEKEGISVKASFLNNDLGARLKNLLAITPRGTINPSTGEINIISFDITPKLDHEK